MAGHLLIISDVPLERVCYKFDLPVSTRLMFLKETEERAFCPLS